MEPLRICRKCGKTIYNKEDLRLFRRNKRITCGYDNFCLECGRKYYHENKINEIRNRKQRKIRDDLIKYLGGKCVKCGITDIRVLEIHVPNENEKKRNSRNMKVLWEERDSLILLCANCYRIEHYK